MHLGKVACAHMCNAYKCLYVFVANTTKTFSKTVLAKMIKFDNIILM